MAIEWEPLPMESGPGCSNPPGPGFDAVFPNGYTARIARMDLVAATLLRGRIEAAPGALVRDMWVWVIYRPDGSVLASCERDDPSTLQTREAAEAALLRAWDGRRRPDGEQS